LVSTACFKGFTTIHTALEILNYKHKICMNTGTKNRRMEVTTAGIPSIACKLNEQGAQQLLQEDQRRLCFH
jgi:hypothetical protein